MLHSPGMVGSKRVLGVSRGFARGAVACVVLGAGACGNGPDLALPGQASAVAGGAGGFEPPSSGAGGVSPTAPCVVSPPAPPVFQSQAVDPRLVARRELYTWTTDEQAAALRSDQVLFTKSEQAGLGPGYAFTYLSELANGCVDAEQQQLATVLGGELFAKKRYAWPEPWATRMGWPGEEYGGNLLRVLLKPEAWLVVLRGGVLSVVDLTNQVVAVSEAVLHPERIGAILFVRDGAAGGPACAGTFVSGENGYREFILGNLAMVEEWSIGTQSIRDRLAANIADLTRFLTRIRTCPPSVSAAQWNL
ncbi:MAG: hypothetical protein ABIQ16_23815, partial [Polyangiaceae bacterium]